ncbi:type II toxin-antitoxin system RelB/DinJ family antitoxin [Enterococcus cecorum]|uniref:type II toxin-antitoxin system RelB/DinJ family antitoxin n=1 Tax=Enterococcus cecorum TaxID=44008 RepID=UPI00148D48E8|nr:type II toxin-antitoxin system RelB/DinJ family antitoxin [Enterococcus cecorum]MCJ0522402.1 type II toxin-antitoxin system RelB/DinJ family antitoxin [Enterococcus cecorum]MCJ0559045.1 type II toxin-antitoxin system RelB/DinJ family antitoxin [Enterococcus cecorum]MCJ0586495.1 type II toxin-antitoxin system RelB/DinJ family antitoxin [Enterococcus cecorum]MCJ0591377.1 type II toxin-antitoxin system RelB/DinJ family antitoxin [Enterococcus cecorum]MCJ0598483.1 type II toxin-antitoxin system
MSVSSKKTASIFTRVTPELKEEAEKVLDQLQIPMSTALSMFLQQVVNQQRIPFEIKLPQKPVGYDSLTKEAFDREIQKGLDDYEKSHIVSADKVKQKYSSQEHR